MSDQDRDPFFFAPKLTRDERIRQLFIDLLMDLARAGRVVQADVYLDRLDAILRIPPGGPQIEVVDVAR